MFGPGPEFYIQYRDNADMLEDVGIYQWGQSSFRTDDRVDRLFMAQATPDLFSTLGATVQEGRLPNLQDDPGRVMVLSDWLWRTWFGADPAVVGRSYEALGQTREVIGVMEPSFRFPNEDISLWVHQLLNEEGEIRPGNFTTTGRETRPVGSSSRWRHP